MPSGRRVADDKRAERERRRAAQAHKRRTQALLVIAAVVAVIVGCGGIYRSQLFEIKSVEVAGNVRLSADGVRARANVPPGATLIRFPSGKIEARLLEDPWISTVSISRDFPGSLRIRIEERIPVAIVDTGEEFWLVDGTGMVLGQESLEGTGTPVVIRDVKGFDPKPGRASTADGLVNALAVLRGLTPAIRDRVKTVSASAIDETYLITADSVEIMVGEAVRMEEKNTIIAQILGEQPGTVVFIDVRSVERPISRGLDE